MAQNPNFIVELFIRTLSIKHKLTFQKDKQEYFRVLFDTYLNGQGNPEELKDYIAAGIDDQHTIDIIADEVIQWQAKAAEMRAAQEAKKQQQLAQKAKLEEYAAKKTAKVKDHEHQRKEKVEEHGKKKHKGQHKPKPETNNQGNKAEHEAKGEAKGEGEGKGEVKGLKYELTQQGKQKCKFFPFCKNPQTCQYFHPTEKCTYFPKCRFGDSCLYEHEACKFKEKCTKMNCPFAHPFKKPNPLEEMMKSFMTQHNPLSRPKKKYHPKNKEHHAGQQAAHEEPKKQ